MANPSSSHHDRDRDGTRVVRERSHHHHRTISSTTLLLILSLVLAVLAVMLSLPSTRGPVSPLDPLRGGSGGSEPQQGAGLLGNIFSPRRSEALVSRESAVAKREAEIARREADILNNAFVTCAPYATVTEVVETIGAPPPIQTIYKEIVKENALTAPGTDELTRRVEDLIQRETKIADREKDMSRREESVNRREHDAQRREAWIMEQLIALGNDPQTIEEEYIIEPTGTKRRLKALPVSEEQPIRQQTQKQTETVTYTETRSIRVPSPANTRHAEFPKPESFSAAAEPPSAPTQVVEVIVDEEAAVQTQIAGETVTIYRSARPSRTPRKWLW